MRGSLRLLVNTQYNGKKTVKKHYLILNLFFLMILYFLGIIKNVFNISLLCLGTYTAYVIMLLLLDVRFFITYFWLFIFASLNILGVFCCEASQIYISELRVTTYYSGALLPLVCVYIVLFACIESRKERCVYVTEAKINENIRLKIKLCKIILCIGIIIIFYLFLKVIKTPYFVTGLSRLEFAKERMSRVDRSLKTLLPIFIPVAVIYGQIKKTKKIYLFIGVLFLYYFWTGDKFGNFVFALYIFTIFSVANFSEKQIRRFIIVLMLFAGFILLIVYLQRVFVYAGSGMKLFVDYLQQRLAGQGEVWWSVYSQMKDINAHFSEFFTEIKAMLIPGSIPVEEYGQWKMMLVTDHYSANSIARVASGIPYTATTTASTYYYFKFIGTLIIYILFGFMYCWTIREATVAFNKKNVFETMIFVKLISICHNMMFASDLYIISYKGMLYLITLFVLQCFKFKIAYNRIN